MKLNIHPKYYENTNVRCACGNKFTTGSIMPEINVEICSNCHPFYTGKEKFADTRGRLEKYKKRLEKSQTKAMGKVPHSKTKKTHSTKPAK